MTEQVNVAAIIAALKDINEQDLWEIHDQCAKELKKRTKEPKAPKQPKETTQKPASTWQKWVFNQAEKRGWESFTKVLEKTDSITGEKKKVSEQMPESIEHNGCFVYKGSENTKKNPNGKKINSTDAKDLAKQYWQPKAKEGTRPDLYEEYLRSSEPEPVAKEPVQERFELKEVAKPKVPAAAIAQPIAPVAQPKVPAAAIAQPIAPVAQPIAQPIAPVAQPIAPVAQPVAQVAEKKKLTEAEKAEKKQKKADKEKKKLEKEKKKLEKEAKKKDKQIVKTGEWTCQDDGKAHEFPINGKVYLRDFKDRVWYTNGKNEKGEPFGMWDREKKTVDDSKWEETEEETEEE